MENRQLVPFCYGDHLVRVFEDESGNPWWVAKDVCKILEIQNSRDALSALDEDEKSDVEISDISSNRVVQRRKYSIISESGLYALVFRSRKPEARAFSKWVRSEVLPQIRKTGKYEAAGRRLRGADVAYGLPSSLLEMAAGLKPAMRQRLWRDALDSVRLDGGGFAAACECFGSLCGLMLARRKIPDAESLILRFMDERLEQSKGFNTPFSRIKKAFSEWWQDFGSGSKPGSKTLSAFLRNRYVSYKSNVTVYRDCRICEAI